MTRLLIPAALTMTRYNGICEGCEREIGARPCAAMIASTGRRIPLCAACYRDLMRIHRFARLGLVTFEETH